jgi:hypothetical protein
MSSQPLTQPLTYDIGLLSSLSSATTSLILDVDGVNSSVLLTTDNTPAIYLDKFRNLGINTTSPDAQLVVNSANGSCIQTRYNDTENIATINVSSDGKMKLNSFGGEIIVDTGNSFNIKTHNGTSAGLYLNNSLVRATADQLNYNNLTTAGTAEASKAIILDSNRDIINIRNLTATNLTGTLQTGSQPNISSVASLNITAHNGLSTGLSLGGTLITTTAARLNLISESTAGTASANNFVLLDTNRDIININSLTASTLTGTIQTAAQPNITSIGTLDSLNIDGSLTGLSTLSINTDVTGRTLILNDASGNCLRLLYNTATGTQTNYTDFILNSVGDLNIASSNGNVDISTHNGDTIGLKLGGTLIRASADQINYLHDTTPGTVSGGKVFIADSSRNIININNLTATNLTGTLLTAAQPNITSINALNIANHNGSTIGLKLNNTLITSTADELNYVDITTIGTAQASKALVIDSNRDIININDLTASTLTGTIQTASQPNITSVSSLNITTHNGTNSGLSLGGTLLLATATQLNDLVGGGSNGTYNDLTVNNNLTLTNANGVDKGLILGSTLVTSSGTQLNYVNITTIGTAQASKALIVDSNRDIININALTASTLTGTLLTATQTNITSVGILSSLSVNSDSSTTNLITADMATSTSNKNALTLKSIYSGTAAIGAGVNLAFNAPNNAGTSINSSSIKSSLTNVTPSSESGKLDFVLVNGSGSASPLILTPNLITMNGFTSSASTVSTINQLINGYVGNASNGLGISTDYYTPDSTGASNMGGSIQYILESATAVTLTSKFSFNVKSSGSIITPLEIKGTGSLVSVLNLKTTGTLDVNSSTSNNNIISTFTSINNTSLTLSNNSSGFGAGMIFSGYNSINASKNLLKIDPKFSGFTAGGEYSIVDFTTFNNGAVFTPLKFTTNGCTIAAANTNGYALLLSTKLSANNQTSDIIFESSSNGDFMGKIRINRIDANNTAFSFLGKSASNEYTSLTITPTSTGGALTNISNITTTGSNNISSTTYTGTQLFQSIPRINVVNKLGVVSYSATVSSSTNQFASPDTNQLSVSTTDFSSIITVTTNVHEVSGYIIPGFTETYTYTLTIVNSRYRLWIDGNLKAQNWGGSASDAVTITGIVSTVNVRIPIYLQVGSIGATPTFKIEWSSTSRAIQTIPSANLILTSINEYVNKNKYSVANQLTIYDAYSSGTNLLKAEMPIDSSGNLSIKSSGLTTSIDSTNNFDVAGHNGSSLGLKLGGFLVTSTASQLNTLSGVTAGTASASKALIVDSNRNIININDLTASTLTGTIQTAAQPNITSLGTLSTLTISGDLVLGSTVFTASSFSALSGVTPGTASASKVLIVDSSRNIVNINDLTASTLTGTIQTAAQTNITSLGTLSALSISGNLTMGATVISESEIGVLDGVTAGTVTADKAVVVDSNKDISSFRNLTATNLTGTIQTAAQPNITSLGTLSTLTISGDLILGSTTFDASSFSALSGVTPGTASADKALIVDSNRDIVNIRNLTATNLTGTIQTAAQTNITSLGTLSALSISGNLTMGSTVISESEIGVLDGVTAGTASASKALVVDSSRNIVNINDLTASTLTGSLQTAAQTNITSLGTLSALSISGNLTMGSTVISESEIGVLDGVTAGTASASKALVVDSSRNIVNINDLTASTLTGTIQTAAQPNINSVDILDITTHDGATVGLSLDGTLITATATELNYVDVTTGTASASKALVVDSLRDIVNIRNLTASTLTGSLQTAAQTNITSLGTLSALSISGSLTMGSTVISESEIGVLDGVTAGTASASKALVVDSLRDIVNINDLTASTLTGTIQTAAQTNITSLGTLSALSISGNLTMGATVISEGEIGVLDGVTAGTVTADKAVVVDSNKDISSFRNLTATNLTGTIQTAAQTNITSLGTLSALSISGSLTMGSTVISESEIGVLDGVTAGTASASKALVVDSSRNITNINDLTASTLTGTIQTAAQTNITSLGTLSALSISGSLTMGSTVISESEIGVLDGVTAGTASASKALVVDSSRNIVNINDLTVSTLTGTIQTAAQTNITSLGTLSALSISGSLTIGSTVISESEIGVLDGVTAGTASASKALIVNSSRNITNINNISVSSLAINSPSNTNLPLEVGYTSYQFTGAYAYSNDTNAHGLVDAGDGITANYSLRTDGRILVTGEVEITSDKRLKKDIEPLTSKLAKDFIYKTTPVRFNWKNGDTQTDYGYIAQDIKKAGFDDLVQIVPHYGMVEDIEADGFINPKDSKFTFSPGKIIPLLALNQKNIYDELSVKDNKIINLEDRIIKLESIINDLLDNSV